MSLLLLLHPSSDPPLSLGIWGEGMATTGKIRQIEVTENSFFYCSQVTRCSTRAHKHLHSTRCLNTSERFPWIMCSCLSLITRCQNSKSGLYHLALGSKPNG